MVKIEESYSLKSSNTFGIQSYAAVFSKAETREDLQELISLFQNDHRPKLLIGGGSNLLFTGDFDGVVIAPDLKGKDVVRSDHGHVWIRAYAGEVWDDFVEYCVSKNWGGVENLSLIPGNVGACPIQNIGAYGVEVKDVIDSVEVLDRRTGEFRILTNAECKFGYRDSIFKREAREKYIIVAVTFRLSVNPVPNICYKDVEEELKAYDQIDVRNIRRSIINIRRRKLPDPEDYGNAGSFFKNPFVPLEKFESLKQEFGNVPSYPADHQQMKISAAWLIQTSGWKGKREGNVGSYPAQPLVLVNYGGATGNEVLEFAFKIQETVKQQFGIDLEMEVNVI